MEHRGPSLAEVQAAGFLVGGEPLAVDLANTVITVTDPATDLLADAGRLEAFWRLHGPVLPEGWTVPSLELTLELRAAVRRLLDAAIEGTSPDRAPIDVVNATAARALTSSALRMSGGSFEVELRWHSSDTADLTLATAARSLHAVLTDPAKARLRRCANPACSMLFVADDARRKWCAPNLCGNRTRVARHYQRHHTRGG